MGRLLGIDYGRKRIGLSLSDETRTIATPYKVVVHDAHVLPLLERMVREKGVEAVVLGWSRTYRGEENPIMVDIRRFKDRLEQMLKLPVHFESEMLTSVQAARHEVDRALRDASAAALILQAYLDKQQTSRRRLKTDD